MKVRVIDYYEAYTMATHMFIETEGENCLSPKEWVDYVGFDITNKIYITHRKTLLHNYIEDIYMFQQSY